MKTFVTLYNFTEQGLHTIKDSVKRAEAVKDAALRSGIKIKEVLWLQGPTTSSSLRRRRMTRRRTRSPSAS